MKKTSLALTLRCLGFAVCVWTLYACAAQPAGEQSLQAAQLASNTNARISPAERLNIAEFAFDDEGDSNREFARLEQICTGTADIARCRATNFRPRSRRIALVRRTPSETGEIVGELQAVLNFDPDRDLGYGIEFRPRNPANKGGVWLESVGDWGYGIEIPGVRLRGNWVQLFGPPLPAESWIDGRTPSFRTILAGDIEGEIVSLPAMVALFPDGMRRPIMPGSYVVERIRGDQITFRQELETDFPCSDDVKPPAMMPPSMQANAAALFSNEGEPLFVTTHSRGC